MQQNGTSASQQSLEALRVEHGTLDARLQQLDRHRSLSPEEQYEVQIIKKRKLALKDEISRMEDA